ncbi:MAG: hypothetical protein AAB075_03990, partial [Gemmatimonadota bacterium]
HESVLDAVLNAGCRIASLFARQEGDSIELVAVVASDSSSELGLIRTSIDGDAFESLTVGRPYRDPVSDQEALAELNRAAGSQFDAEVVACLVAIVTEQGDRAEGGTPPHASAARPAKTGGAA